MKILKNWQRQFATKNELLQIHMLFSFNTAKNKLLDIKAKLDTGTHDKDVLSV